MSYGIDIVIYNQTDVPNNDINGGFIMKKSKNFVIVTIVACVILLGFGLVAYAANEPYVTYEFGSDLYVTYECEVNSYKIYEKQEISNYQDVSNVIICESEINCIYRQYDLLNELMELQQTSRLVVPLSTDGVPLEIPQINMIIPATSVSGRFTIGLEVCIGDLGYEDTDAILEITSQEPNKEVVDFILSFAGISHDQATVAYGVFLPTPRLPVGYVISGPCRVWGD